jgi:hypothetical protein
MFGVQMHRVYSNTLNPYAGSRQANPSRREKKPDAPGSSSLDEELKYLIEALASPAQTGG